MVEPMPGTPIDPDPAELRALYQIATVSSTHGDVNHAISEIARAIVEALPARRAFIFLYSEQDDDLVVHSLDQRRRGRVALAEPSSIARIFHSGRGEIINDLNTDPDSTPTVNALLGSRQLVAAPLETAGQKMGVIAAVDAERGAFTESDLRLLSALSDRAAHTVESALLVDTLQHQVQELEGLHRLTRLLTSWETTDHVVGEAVRIVADLLACEQIAILHHDEESGDLLMHAHDGLTPSIEEPDLRIGLRHPSLVATVFRTNTPLYSNEAKSDEWVSPELAEALGAESMLVVPLSTGPKPSGVLVAVNGKKGPFDDDDVRFAMLLGGRVASVLDSSRARERERNLVAQLREADRTKSEFVSMLAHELSGPMTTIIGFSQSLRDGWQRIADERRTDILTIMNKEVERLARLVNDLLDVARMEAGTLRYDLEPMSIPELVSSVLEVHSSLRTDHMIQADIPEDLPAVRGDKDRLRQVVINLLTNATRYSPSGTTVTISARYVPDDDVVVVGVADQGIGIKEDDRERIFGKFAMLPRPSWVKKGTGLGLFITKGIIDAHGGELWVDSEAGQGSTFNFSVAVAR
ncbi:MAG: GAF domain-containing protein [Actinomycetota bacterium]